MTARKTPARKPAMRHRSDAQKTCHHLSLPHEMTENLSLLSVTGDRCDRWLVDTTRARTREVMPKSRHICHICHRVAR